MLSSFKRLKDLAALSVVLTAFSVTPIEALDLKMSLSEDFKMLLTEDRVRTG